MFYLTRNRFAGKYVKEVRFSAVLQEYKFDNVE